MMTLMVILLASCNGTSKKQQTTKEQESLAVNTKANDLIPFFEHWNLILGDGSNVGQATDYENKDYFYTSKDDHGDWVVFKSPNAGSTHGSSNNTRTDLFQTLTCLLFQHQKCHPKEQRSAIADHLLYRDRRPPERRTPPRGEEFRE